MVLRLPEVSCWVVSIIGVAVPKVVEQLVGYPTGHNAAESLVPQTN